MGNNLDQKPEAGRAGGATAGTELGAASLEYCFKHSCSSTRVLIHQSNLLPYRLQYQEQNITRKPSYYKFSIHFLPPHTILLLRPPHRTSPHLPTQGDFMALRNDLTVVYTIEMPTKIGRRRHVDAEAVNVCFEVHQFARGPRRY